MAEEEDSTSALQGILQQRNFLKYTCIWQRLSGICTISFISPSPSVCVCVARNRNPRDPLNINLRKAFLDYDKSL